MDFSRRLEVEGSCKTNAYKSQFVRCPKFFRCPRGVKRAYIVMEKKSVRHLAKYAQRR